VRRLLLVLTTVALVGVAASTAGAASTHAASQNATATAAPKNDLRIVTINVLHGIICPNAPDDCQGDDRIALLGQQLQAAKCPPVVALEEINDRTYNRVTAAPWVKSCKYKVVWHDMPLTDRELVLTTLPVTSQKLTVLAGDFRSAYRVELRSKLGPLVLVATHQDGDSQPGADPRLCTPEACPPPCPPEVTQQTCQTIQAAALASEGGGRKAIRVLTGDLNVTATSERYRLLVDDGWIDSHLAAGNPECDPATGVACTSGRRDNVVDDLKDPASKQTERIDFLFVKAPRGCKLAFDRAGDRDKDKLGTGLFADKPVTNGPGGLAYLSDHTGTAADLSCGKA
jgi:hypothetical protein